MMRRQATLLGLIGLLSLAGCTVLHLPGRLRSAAETAPLGGLDDGYEDHAGVIHVHTNVSHDADGSFDDVVRTANAQGLDYVILTEHNTLRPLRDGRQGWHGETLILIGAEYSTRSGHLLALNAPTELDRHALSPQELIDAVNAQGGLAIIAHPYFKKARWTDWSVQGVVGMEAYNVAHDTLDENKARLAMWTLFSPIEPFYLSILDRPYDPLATWDDLIARRGRVVGIGSTDAHEFHFLGVRFAPYDIMFQLARTHVLTPPGPLTADAVYEALRRGHAYFAMELMAPATHAVFFAHDGKRVVGIMGDELPWRADLMLTAALSAPAELTLMRDGHAAATATTDTWQLPVTEPGAYRLEATRNGTPWLFTNPIYIRPADAPLSAPSGAS